MNVMIFWFITLVILFVCCALFILPMLASKKVDEQASRDELNKAFFHDRMAEISNEADQGVVSAQEEITLELKQSLLDDIPSQQAESASSGGAVSKLMLLPAVVVLFLLSYGLYWQVGSYDKVVHWQKVHARLPDLSRLLNTGEQLTDQEMQDIMLAMRTQMVKTPNEPMGWLLLGRLGMANRDVLTTEGAMQRAYQLDPNHPEIQLGYAQSLMLSGEEAKSQQARVMLNHLAAQDAGNLQALSLLAFDAFERRDFVKAIELWTAMKAGLAADDPRQDMLSRSIEKAKATLNPATSATSINVMINLDPEVKLPDEAVVIVSVHDEQGSPMPVAAKLLPLSGFPMVVSLTDEDSMIKARLLSSLGKVIVRARIDSDGNVMTKNGDWSGESQVTLLGDSADITINQQLK